MCKWIKDILFPTNVLGKKKKSIRVDLENPPYDARTFDIVWSGERLDVIWAEQKRNGINMLPVVDHRETFTDGDMTAEQVIVIQRVLGQFRQWTDAIYFNCTNVTYLSINGEQYI